MTRDGRDDPSARGSWLYTAWIIAVLVVLLPPLRVWLQFAPSGARSRRLVRRCARLVVAATFCPVEVRGAGALTDIGSVMLVSNHASMADAAFLLAALPIDLQFVANHTAARYPILGLAVQRASYVIVDRGSWRSRAECGAAMVEALRGGHSLLVFPEGTTADAGGLLPFRSGAFRAAVHAGRPVVPIVLHGTRTMFPVSGRLQRTTIRIDVLAPIAPAGNSRHDLAQLKEQSVAAIAGGLGIELSRSKGIGRPLAPRAAGGAN